MKPNFFFREKRIAVCFRRVYSSFRQSKHAMHSILHRAACYAMTAIMAVCLSSLAFMVAGLATTLAMEFQTIPGGLALLMIFGTMAICAAPMLVMALRDLFAEMLETAEA